MSKRAEEAAFRAYESDVYSGGKSCRRAYKNGYEQAEKDLALTWEDVAILITIYEQEADAGNISRYDDENAPSIQDASEIILKRFNELRKK